MWDNIDQPGRHCAEGNKPDTEGQILHESPYMKEIGNSQTRGSEELNSSCQELRGKENKVLLINTYKFQSCKVNQFKRSAYHIKPI